MLICIYEHSFMCSIGGVERKTRSPLGICRLPAYKKLFSLFLSAAILYFLPIILREPAFLSVFKACERQIRTQICLILQVIVSKNLLINLLFSIYYRKAASHYITIIYQESRSYYNHLSEKQTPIGLHYKDRNYQIKRKN